MILTRSSSRAATLPTNFVSMTTLIRFAREFFTKKKPVFAICHAAQLLITAQVLKGRRVTGWKSLVQDIKNAGAEYVDEEVVVDGNLVSSRKPSDIPAFVRESLKMLQ